jgi:BD-FAE
MDIIKTIPTSLPEGIAPTYAALYPHLIANKVVIRTQYARLETHSYGANPRQDLDVYYPHSYDDSTPILLFLYGGGFFMGNKQQPNSHGLVYQNLGGFFVQKGFIVVVANYRLVKSHLDATGDAKYPSGGEDAAGAVKWIEENLGAERDVFLMGNSAGAVHVLTFLLEPEIIGCVKAKVSGAVLVSPPCHQRRAGAMQKQINETYYGSPEAVEANSPLALLEKNGPVSVPLLWLVASLDEAGIIQSAAEFKAEYLKQDGELDEIIMEGHNHISPIPALNSQATGGSDWGDNASEWMLKHKTL